jgi:hypothetical protein
MGNEADTCRKYVLPKLYSAGWNDDQMSIDGRGDWLFFHETDVAEGVWNKLSSGIRVAFAIGFNLRGPKCLNLCLESKILGGHN